VAGRATLTLLQLSLESDGRDQIGRNVGAVQLEQMHAHSTSVHADYVIVEARHAALVLGDQFWLEAAEAVTGNVEPPGASTVFMLLPLRWLPDSASLVRCWLNSAVSMRSASSFLSRPARPVSPKMDSASLFKQDTGSIRTSYEQDTAGLRSPFLRSVPGKYTDNPQSYRGGSGLSSVQFHPVCSTM